MVILCVGLEMLCEVVDAFAEDGHLHFRGSGVCVVRLVTANELRLAILGQRHLLYLHARPSAAAPDAPSVRKIVSRARSTCYTRTTEGCKSPAAVAGRQSRPAARLDRAAG